MKRKKKRYNWMPVALNYVWIGKKKKKKNYEQISINFHFLLTRDGEKKIKKYVKTLRTLNVTR